MGLTVLSVLSLFLLNITLCCGDAQDAELSLKPNVSHLFAGESVTFICDMREGNATDWFYKFNWNDQEMVHFTKSSSYSLYLTAELSGNYQCIGRRNGLKDFTKQSNNLTLSISAHRPTATITADKTTVPVGGSVTLTCSVQGSAGWTYDWFRQIPDSREVAINTNSLQNFISVSDEGIYQCRGRRGNPVFFTNLSKVYHIQKTLSNRAFVTLQQNWTQIFSGEMITIKCEIQGGENTEWQYEWRTTSSKTPPTHSEYNISRASFTYNGQYWCKEIQVIRNEEPDQMITVTQGGIYYCKGGRGNPVFFTEDSDPITIEKRVSNKAVVSLEPSWPLIFSGEKITVRCQISLGRRTEWEYEWSKPDSSTGLANNASINLNASVISSGSYRCMGKNKQELYSVTEWSDVITLTVSGNRPKTSISADSRVLPEGDTVTLTCSVTLSTPGWSFYWYRGKKTSEPLTMAEVVLHSDGQIGVSQEGDYWCRGGRGNPVYYTDYSDVISIKKTVRNRPAVTLHPNWPEVYSRETITLKCEIPGEDTEWDYEWATSSSHQPPNQNEYKINSVSTSHRGHYWCKGRMRSAQQNSTMWSASFQLKIVYNKPRPVLTVSPSWLSPGASVTLNCEVEHPSAGWSFYWYKAVHDLKTYSYEYYIYELLPDGSGTAQDSYIIHGQTHTAGYVCRAGRGDPEYHTDHSQPKFVWSADLNSAASLTVSPNSVQHFIYDSVTLNCSGNSSQWRIMIFTQHGYLRKLRECGNWGIMTESTCNIDLDWYHRYHRYPVYWCESESGQFSNGINITARFTGVILVSPVHPVNEGDSVALGCKLRTGNFNSTVAFYKNGKLIQNDDREKLNIPAVSKSDEGFYKCEYSGHESPQSLMSVKGSRSSLSVSLITGLVSGVSLILLLSLLLCCWHKKPKGTLCIRPAQSQETSQTAATVQTMSQDENQQQIYSSLLHGDMNVYESCRPSENTGGRTDDYRNISLQLRSVGQRGKRDDPEETSDYHNVDPNSATESCRSFQTCHCWM
ncbi:Fc receptor-like protein 5 [Oreochromis niloticus]|uniref:Fc receptor-like protein 5 n=1 Tax=Oreochromis niloticus TaxID=8128 RepID=UPI000DF32547|nr:Fc receptor-like protein 5 [Oreochromis niloticus]